MRSDRTCVGRVRRVKVIGVDVGGTKVSVATLEGTTLSEPRLRPTETESPEALVDQLTAAIEELGPVDAVGIGIPSVVDFETGSARSSVNIPLQGVPLRQLLTDRLGCHVFVDNDATVAALAEAYDDDLEPIARCLVMLTVGTGVGGGIVINGQVYRGATGAAAELGHQIVGADLVKGAPPHAEHPPQPGSPRRLPSRQGRPAPPRPPAAARLARAARLRPRARRARPRARLHGRPRRRRRRQGGRREGLGGAAHPGRAPRDRRRQRDQHLRPGARGHRRRRVQRRRPAARPRARDGPALRPARRGNKDRDPHRPLRPRRRGPRRRAAGAPRIHYAHRGPHPERTRMSSTAKINERLAAITAAGTSIWLDQIQRSLVDTGELRRLVEEDSLRGVTSNPAIFENAILGPPDYDEQIEELARSGGDARGISRAIAIRDVLDACDVLE